MDEDLSGGRVINVFDRIILTRKCCFATLLVCCYCYESNVLVYIFLAFRNPESRVIFSVDILPFSLACIFIVLTYIWVAFATGM